MFYIDKDSKSRGNKNRSSSFFDFAGTEKSGSFSGIRRLKSRIQSGPYDETNQKRDPESKSPFLPAKLSFFSSLSFKLDGKM